MSYRMLVMDTGGLHVATAHRLAEDGNDVAYWNPYHSPYAKFKDYAPGVGIPGVKKVEDFGPYLENADLVVFPDVGLGDFAHYLRKSGKRVFGAGRGEELEQDRVKSAKIMDEIGIKYPKTHVAKGIPGAIEMLDGLFKQKHETNQNASGKYFCKINMFRGDIDTFPVASTDEARFMFESLAPKVGPYGATIPVVIQETVEGVEVGADLFFDGQRYSLPYMWGFESSNDYVGVMTDDLGMFGPDLLKLQEYLKRIGYRGAISFEGIYDGQTIHMIDWTMRFPMPLGMIYANYIPDLGSFMVDVASSAAKKFPINTGKWLGCMAVTSEEALDRWIPLKGNSQTRFLHYMQNEGKTYAVPGVSLVGAVMGQGDNMAEVQADATKNAKDLSVFFGNFNPRFAEDIKEKFVDPLYKKHGIRFGA